MNPATFCSTSTASTVHGFEILSEAHGAVERSADRYIQAVVD
jgi:hypothetical protein